MTQPVIFISYSHKDEKEKDRLLSHLDVLQVEELIGLWSDDRIGAGADWEQEIREAMTQARVAILLISRNFLTSNFILREEVPTLLKRRKSEGLTVFPVIARPCAWQAVDWLTRMNIRPKNGRPIWSTGSRRVDEDLAAIAKEVEAIVKTSVPGHKFCKKFGAATMRLGDSANSLGGAHARSKTTSFFAGRSR